MRRATPQPGVPRAGLAYRFAAWVAIGVMRLFRWRLDVSGLEHVPAVGGCLIAANHHSYWDFVAIARSPYLLLGRPVRILAKHSLFEVPVFGRILGRTGCIPVDRANGGGALRHAVAALRAGELVLVLPEATISTSFDLLEFRSGAARMATEAGVPLVPAASWGTQRFFTSGHGPHWTWRMPVTVRFGEPMHPTSADPAAEVMSELRRRIRALLDDAISSYPDGAPKGAWWVPARLGGGAPDHADAEREWREKRARWRHRGRSP